MVASGVLFPFITDIEQQPPAAGTINQVSKLVAARNALGQATSVFCVGGVSGWVSLSKGLT